MVTSQGPARKLITTGNIEIDGKIGGGLPPSSLTLIEGQSDAGKSVLVQQFMWGSSAERPSHRHVYDREHHAEPFAPDDAHCP